MTYKITAKAIRKITVFYQNVAKKYKNAYSPELMKRNIDESINAMYQIENGLLRREPTIPRWKGLYMATSSDKRWYFAYRIDGATVYVEDACHSQNMHESKKSVIRLTEQQLTQIIRESIERALNII